ncbi:hypothetical protein SD37_26215 [Amycolatopsis orientalis]|uniref:HEAT repeat domain-containing protein n=1 Tax=Amycolatopsis orientalis TaxID=31958 RepID=A0A193C2L3_AMYOR|nr:hypothetical protein SD37_26215 [Amycolatopsis orientalis]
MLDVALASARLAWPAGTAVPERRHILDGLLASSGAFVSENGELRFARPALRDYLAACHVHRHHPRGPRLTEPSTWKYLKPRKSRPWPEAGLNAFLAGLWWKNERPAVERRLRHLVHHRHWEPNIGFVVDLIRRDLLPGNDLREQVVDILRGALRDPGQDDERWSVAANELQLIDPVTAADELDALVSFARPTARSRRRYDAVVALLQHDRVRGMNALEVLARNLTGLPQDRYDTALLIGELDQDQGEVAMLYLADTEEMGDLRADAAIILRRPELLRELVAEGRGLSDDARLRALDTLLPLDSEIAVTAAERFAATSADDDTPLRVAELIRHESPRTALRIAADIAWQEDQDADSETRYDAVLMIGKIDTAEAIPALRRLSESKFTHFEVRLRAASRILTEYGGPIDALVALAEAPEVTWENQARAAEALKEAAPEAGARRLVAIAGSGPSTDASRFTILKKAHKIAPREAAAEIEKFVKSHAAGPVRLKAVELVVSSLSSRSVIDLYAAIVATADGESAMTAARKVLAMHHPRGLELMGRVADRTAEDPQFRLTAATEAGEHGKRTLLDLAQTARSDRLRLQAAQALLKIDRAGGRSALKKLVKKARPSRIRIDAALSLPGTAATDALAYIVDDRHETESVRFEAATEAWDLNVKCGRELMGTLAKNPANSPKTRERAQRYLDK